MNLYLLFSNQILMGSALKSSEMRKFIFIFMSFLLPFSIKAKETDTENMGALAGAVLACGAYRQLYQFEEILSRYFSNTAPNKAAEEAEMQRYARSKATSYAFYRTRSKRDCSSTIATFIQMPVFKTELYSDGTIRTPEGKFLYPRGQKGLAKDAEKIYPRR